MQDGPITDLRAAEIAIGQLADRTGVNIETIRYYERIALLPAPPRTSGGRRSYGPEHVRLVSFVRRSRELGFGIDDIRTLLTLARPGKASCAEVERVAGAHLKNVRAKLADLARLELVLAETVAQCALDATPACPVLDALGAPLDAGTAKKFRG